MENPRSWSPVRQEINKALDYRSPGSEQAASVLKHLSEKGHLKVDPGDDVRKTLADAIDDFARLLKSGFCGKSLAGIVEDKLTEAGLL